MTDLQLLRDFARHRTDAAFAELVRRHVDLVYSAALRMVHDTHLAEDVTQGVFVVLAQNATQLTNHPVLSGWLHRTTQNLAAKAVRSDVRRRVREQEAVAMNELLSSEPDATWDRIAPHLDAALGELSDPDRDALLLRYFERKSAREIIERELRPLICPGGGSYTVGRIGELPTCSIGGTRKYDRLRLNDNVW